MEIPKLVTVTRTDIPEGYQAVQSTHAAIDFIFEHPTRAGPWHKDSNTLVMLTTKDEKGLKHLMRKCDYLSLVYTAFREPDYGNEITAICIEPHPETLKMVAKLPLLIPKIENNEQNNNGNQSQISQQSEEPILQEMGHNEVYRERENTDSTGDFSSDKGSPRGIECLQREEETESLIEKD